MTATERKKLQSLVLRRVRDSINDPRPPIPHEQVFADLKARSRAEYPMSHLKPEGALRYRRYVAIYARDPDHPTTIYGKIANRKDTLQFTAASLVQLERRFHRVVHDYEAFCNKRAVE